MASILQGSSLLDLEVSKHTLPERLTLQALNEHMLHLLDSLSQGRVCLSLWVADTGATVLEAFLPIQVRVSKRFWPNFWAKGGFRVTQTWNRCSSAVAILEAGSAQKLMEINSMQVLRPKNGALKKRNSIKFDVQPLSRKTELEHVGSKLATFLKKRLHLDGSFAVIGPQQQIERSSSQLDAGHQEGSSCCLVGVTPAELLSSTTAEQRDFFVALNNRIPNGCEGVIWVTKRGSGSFKACVWTDPSYAREIDFSRSSLTLELNLNYKLNHPADRGIQLELIDYFHCLLDSQFDPQ